MQNRDCFQRRCKEYISILRAKYISEENSDLRPDRIQVSSPAANVAGQLIVVSCWRWEGLVGHLIPSFSINVLQFHTVRGRH